MRRYSLLSFLLVFILAACVDRVIIDVGTPTDFSVVIEGFISDQPGPYEVTVSKGFDIESKHSLKVPLAVKRLIVFDDQGNSEELTTTVQGTYLTDPNGIRGQIGHSYYLRAELLDGRVYQSEPELISPAGTVDSVFFAFKTTKNAKGADEHGFDVFFNSSANNDSFYFMWKFTGTYQVETNPELHTELVGQNRVSKPRPCSGFIVNVDGSLEQIGPCECCTCWYNFFNATPIISDNQLVNGGKFKAVKAMYVPVNQWTFLHKVYAQIEQQSLSARTFAFWKGIKDQKEATTSLFQPITGKITGNFHQIAGEPKALEGIFYATSISSNGVFIRRNDVPNERLIPPRDLPFTDTCKDLFPYSTTVQPSYWSN